MKQKKLFEGFLAFMFALFIFLTFSNAYGSGFAVYTQGGSSLGQGAATIAHADDPSAIFFNPALINKLEGTQVELGTTLIFPSREFKSDITGKTYKAESDVLYPSTVFITQKFNDKISAGLGVFNPFGLSNKWGDNWEGRYLTTNAEMTTYNINPVVSYRITPNIALAAGLEILLLDATLENKINLSAIPGLPPGIPDAGQKFKGDGNGIGCNFGILIEPHKDISIGASYRSEIKVDIDGDATFDLPDPSLRAFFPNATGTADLTLPQQVHVGVYYKGFNPLSFEVGLRWEGWSSYDQLKIELADGRTSVAPKDWKDTYSANIGAKYQLNETVALLAGYLYGGNPIPDKTFEPSIPDADTHLFCIGTDVKYKKFRFDLSYAYQYLQSRHKNNLVDDLNDGVLNPDTSANGKYNSNLHMVGLSLTYQF
jgi:long-chain fatty acid transport protein